MIKFNCLIHKETGTVIKYEDWLKYIELERREKQEIEITIKNIRITSNRGWVNRDDYLYRAKEILFDSDFEIIYDSEFTTEELETIKESLGYSLDEDLIKCEGYDIQTKISELLGEKEYIKNKYGIEV